MPGSETCSTPSLSHEGNEEAHLYWSDVNGATSRKKLEAMFKGKKNRPVYLQDPVFNQNEVVHQKFKVQSDTFERVQEDDVGDDEDDQDDVPEEHSEESRERQGSLLGQAARKKQRL